jgi:hypothetical protein
MIPKGFLAGRASDRLNTKTEVATTKIGGRNFTGVAARGITTFPNIFLSNSMMKRE